MVDWAELARFAARIVDSRTYEGVGARCARQRHAGEALDRFAARRELRSTIAGLETAPPRPSPQPEAVSEGLAHSQKPFHLWNVARMEHDEEERGFAAPEPALRIGRGAVLPDELRVPRKLAKATRLLMAHMNERSVAAMGEKLARMKLRSLLRSRLPFGRPDAPTAEEAQGLPAGAAFMGLPPSPAPFVPPRVGPFVRQPGPAAPAPPRVVADDDDEEPFD